MAIIKNRHYGNFTQIDNAVIHSGISLAALGALVMLLAHGPNWNLNVKNFATESGSGEKATRTAINELIRAGHIEEIKERDEKGRYKPTIYNVYETPKKTEQDSKPESDTPVKKDSLQAPNADNPHGGNRHVDNGDAIPYYSNKEASKKEALKTEAEKATPALPHGKHENVFLTDNEYRTLVETYGKEQTDYSIDTLSDFKKKKPNFKSIRDFNRLMKEWIKRDIGWGKTPKTYVPYQVSAPQPDPETSKKQDELSAIMAAMLAGDYDSLEKGLKEAGF